MIIYGHLDSDKRRLRHTHADRLPGMVQSSSRNVQ